MSDPLGSNASKGRASSPLGFPALTAAALLSPLRNHQNQLRSLDTVPVYHFFSAPPLDRSYVTLCLTDCPKKQLRNLHGMVSGGASSHHSETVVVKANLPDAAGSLAALRPPAGGEVRQMTLPCVTQG